MENGGGDDPNVHIGHIIHGLATIWSPSHIVIQISHNNANQRTHVILPTTRIMRSLVSIIMGYMDDYMVAYHETMAYNS